MFCEVYTDASCLILELSNRGGDAVGFNVRDTEVQGQSGHTVFFKLLYMAGAIFLTSIGIDFKSQKPPLMLLSFLHLKQQFLSPPFALPKGKTCL